jgi:hypothetical protein
MSNMNSAALRAQLAAIAKEPPKARTGKANARVKSVFAPKPELIFAKAGEFTWKIKNAKGNDITYTSPSLRVVIFDQDFTFREIGQNEQGGWAVKCGVVSHKTQDEHGEAVDGNGWWKLPFWDRQEVFARYQPVGMKLDPETQAPMACETCTLRKENTCKDTGSLKVLILEVLDPKTEEWKTPEVFDAATGKFVQKPLVASIRTSRKDFDPFRKYAISLYTNHEAATNQVVTELRVSDPDTYGNHRMLYREEDLLTGSDQLAGYEALYQEAFDAWDAERKARIEAYKAQNPAQGAQGNRPQAKPEAAKATIAELPKRPAPKPEAKPVAKPSAPPADEDEAFDDIPF